MADPQTLLAVIGVLVGFAALWWLALAWAWRVAPRATRRMATANLLFGLSVVGVLLRDGSPSFLYWPLADLLGLSAFALMRSAVQHLFDLRSSARIDAGVLMLAAMVDFSVMPAAVSTPTFMLVYSSAMFALAAPLAVDAYRPAAREFNAALGAMVTLPFALIAVLMLVRAAIALADLRVSAPGAVIAPDSGAMRWSYVLLTLMLNFSLMACVLTRLVQVIRRHAEHDSLTGLLNRRAFETRWRLERARVARSDQPYALVLLDLDHFKRINDQYGHAAGDAALQHVAAVIAPALRPADAFARYGGEEFIVLLPDTDVEGGIRLAERLRERLQAQPLAWRGGTLPVRASFGVGDSRGAQDDELLREVDAALYAAKRAGRDRVCRAAAVMASLPLTAAAAD